jgi:transmembrane sensor
LEADRKHMDHNELLVKYLAGEAGADERASAETWIGASDANKKYFEHFKLIWEESQKLAGSSTIDEDKAWNRFRERIQKEYIAVSKPKNNFQWLKVAAIILLVSGTALLGPYFFKRNDGRFTSATVNNPPVKNLRSVTANNIRVDTLPDGSVITLNKYSSIKYPADFKGHNRNVELTGEAFFNVKHDQNKPFVIKANDILITVLGTSFNVKSRGDTTTVIVETGIVSVKKKQNIVTLYAGEKLTTSEKDNTLKKEPNKDKLYRSYFDKKPTRTNQSIVKAKPGTPFDISKHPDLLKQITYTPQSEDIKVRRAVIRKMMDEMTTQKLVNRDSIRSFRLNDTVLLINDRKQPEAVHQRFKNRFIKEPGYTIYFGGSPKDGNGIYMMPDSL